MKNTKTIKRHILESGRYDQIKSLISENVVDYEKYSKSEFPITFSTNSVYGYNIFMGFNIVERIIEADTCHDIAQIILTLDEVEIQAIGDMRDWIIGETARHLYNYGNTISHRKECFEPDMNTIRQWLVVRQVVEFVSECLWLEELLSEEDILKDLEDFYIPIGWCSDDAFTKVAK